MTAHPNDPEHECRFPEEQEPSGRLILAPCLACGRTALDGLAWAKDALAAAEHRATRAEAQSEIRGRAVVIYRERAREAEARIKAVRDVYDLHAPEHLNQEQLDPEDCGGIIIDDLRRALDATTTQETA